MGELELRYGDNGRGGDRGEALFERWLGNTEIPNFYTVRHSLRIPTPPGKKPMDGDVDFVIATGTNLVLADAKFWKSGEVMWSTPDGQHMRGDQLHDESPSRNMQIALERYSALLPRCNVSALVIFLPSDRASSAVLDVSRLRWPGDIQSYSASQSYTEILRRLGRPMTLGVPHALDPAMDELLTAMQKSNSIDR